MSQSLELTAKRGIVGGLGVFGLGALLVPIAGVRDNPSPAAWSALGIHLAGPILAIVLLSNWRRWPHLNPQVRVGVLMLTAFALPAAAFAVTGLEDLTEHALVALLVALSATALWWVVRGQRLDAAGAVKP